jgi:MFS family permease
METRAGQFRMRPVIAAASLGTVIEWYDFYLFGSLAPILAAQFFPKDNPTTALLATLATFAAGFIVRPFGALVFGRLGDKAGRKHTFLLTLLIMGGATFAIGCVPSFQSIGYAAPVIVLFLRLLQGLALGGEYGGAATYVAEHAPAGKRGYYTSWIQTTATLGLLLSLAVILLTRVSLDPDKAQSIRYFESWGWRIPFFVSALLVAVSVFIRLRMDESPGFKKIRDEGKIAVNPLRESFTQRKNLSLVLLTLFGAVMGQGVVWYTGQFYAQTFMENTCRIDFAQTRTLLILAIVPATPLFILFGAWSDKVGRKWIMMGGLLLAVCLYRPIYRGMLQIAQPDAAFQTDTATVGHKQAGSLSLFQLRTETTYQNGIVGVRMQTDTMAGSAAMVPGKAGKESKTLPLNRVAAMVGLLFLQLLFVAMVYGPIAAFLVEQFPTRIRYSSMSLPYHIGNGVFGGMTPFIAVLLTTAYPAEPLAGLWYPIAVAFLCLLIGSLYLRNKPVTDHE